jgi:hypothetical protein
MLWKSNPRLKEIQTQGALTDLHQSPEQEREVERGDEWRCPPRGLPPERGFDPLTSSLKGNPL